MKIYQVIILFSDEDYVKTIQGRNKNAVLEEAYDSYLKTYVALDAEGFVSAHERMSSKQEFIRLLSGGEHDFIQCWDYHIEYIPNEFED